MVPGLFVALLLLGITGTSYSFLHPSGQHSIMHKGATALLATMKPSQPFRAADARHKHTIGTRGSPLAQAQALETKRLLEEKFPELQIDIREIITKGDSVLSQALSEIGGKGLFTKELDVYLLDKTVDLCVHSMKDVPTTLPEGTMLACYLPREESHDVFISPKYKTLDNVPDGATIGSASLRRQAQLLAMNPTWNVVNFRGNVQTRLNKLKHGVVDGTMLALAGLKRLGMSDLVSQSEVLSFETMLPAVSQGVIGIQCRTDDKDIVAYLSQLNHVPTQLAVECERGFLAALDGNCRTPIAGQAVFAPDGSLLFKGMISMCDGTDKIVVAKKLPVCNTVEQAHRFGEEAGKDIIKLAGPKRMKAFHDSMFECNVCKE